LVADVQKTELQLIGVVSMFIAAKVEAFINNKFLH